MRPSDLARTRCSVWGSVTKQVQRRLHQRKQGALQELEATEYWLELLADLD